MMFKIVVDIADSSVYPFTDVTGLINQIVYLLRDGFCTSLQKEHIYTVF